MEDWIITTEGQNRYEASKNVAALGIAANICLLCLKLIVGFLGNSQAMIADGFNSIGDVFASVVTLMGSAYAARPKDSEHVFGHGKAEYIASMIIGFSMIAIAVYMALSAAGSLMAGEEMQFSWMLAAAAAITIIVKGILYFYCRRRAWQYKSLLIEANAKDHRNDVFVSLGTVAAVLAAYFGFGWADGAVGIGIAVWIAWTGLSILKKASGVLMDSNLKPEEIEAYKRIIQRIGGVDHIDSVVAKPVGAKYILIVKISVNKRMTVIASHQIATEVKARILHSREEIEDVIVHINPDLPHETV